MQCSLSNVCLITAAKKSDYNPCCARRHVTGHCLSFLSWSEVCMQVGVSWLSLLCDCTGTTWIKEEGRSEQRYAVIWIHLIINTKLLTVLTVSFVTFLDPFEPLTPVSLSGFMLHTVLWTFSYHMWCSAGFYNLNPLHFVVFQFVLSHSCNTKV